MKMQALQSSRTRRHQEVWNSCGASRQLETFVSDTLWNWSWIYLYQSICNFPPVQVLLERSYVTITFCIAYVIGSLSLSRILRKRYRISDTLCFHCLLSYRQVFLTARAHLLFHLPMGDEFTKRVTTQHFEVCSWDVHFAGLPFLSNGDRQQHTKSLRSHIRRVTSDIVPFRVRCFV